MPWVPRHDGGRAVLVSERRSVWDRAVVPPPVIEDQGELDSGRCGPVPTVWTADLVHCRLKAAHAISRQLPRVHLPPLYRSFLGSLQADDAAPARRSAPLVDDDTKLLDWTLERLHAWSDVDRAILMGVMVGRKLKKIEAIVAGICARQGGNPVKKSAIHKRYWRFTGIMADEWNRAREPVDARTRAVWLETASKKD